MNEVKFQWAPFYEALADKLLEYSNKRRELFELIKKLASEQTLTYFHFENEDLWGPTSRNYQIDPFSVMGIFNRSVGVKDENRIKLAQALADKFDIKLPVPTRFSGIPVLDPRKSLFSGMDALWSLFDIAMKETESESFSSEFETAFDRALDEKGNGLAYITMGLYWIRPNVFMTLDKHSREFISSTYGIALPKDPKDRTGKKYTDFLNTLKSKISEQTPGKTFPEISLDAWKQKGSADTNSVTTTGETMQLDPGPSVIAGQTQKIGMHKNIILYGAPGTGKTFSTVLYAVSIIEEKSLDAVKAEDYAEVFRRYRKYKADGLVKFTTFHQSFGYEEFIEGIRPVVSSGDKSKSGSDIEYEIRDGIFNAFCNTISGPGGSNFGSASNIGKDQGVRIPNRVFIIDEINRGNISKIFGELITLIEETKRMGANEEHRVILPYSGQNFGVPENIYIIGTMNTADRSIALIDTALRRRFSFVEMRPDPTLLSGITINEIDLEKLLDTLNKRITILLDREHVIGHSYLLPLKHEPTIDRLAVIFENEIVPLLQEYFYDDYEKIRLVLGDNQKTDDNLRFIIKKTDAIELFRNTEIDFPEYYEINHDAFKRVEAYAFLQ
jgi:hypothetical protein